jgi:hypothetical protein
VEHEISMAFGCNKPILLFIENGVEALPGFISNYCTYCKFDRELLFSPEFLQRAIASIHGMKMEVVQTHEFQMVQTAPSNVIAEFWRSLFELIDHSGSFTWKYSTTRRLKFTGLFKDPIRCAITPNVSTKLKAEPNAFTWSYKIEYETKPFKLTPTEEKHTHDSFQVSFDVNPKPKENDIIQYTMVFESPYLNPVYLEDIQEVRPPILIDGNEYLCFEGYVPVVRTQNMKLQFRFPVSLGLKPEDFEPFVASYYTNTFEYLVESEVKRMTIKKDSFGGNIFIEISTESPLLQHDYGVAWNPPKKPANPACEPSGP